MEGRAGSLTRFGSGSRGEDTQLQQVIHEDSRHGAWGWYAHFILRKREA